jgi:hypothetical protein
MKAQNLTRWTSQMIALVLLGGMFTLISCVPPKAVAIAETPAVTRKVESKVAEKPATLAPAMPQVASSPLKSEIRMPDMLTMPSDSDLRSTNPVKPKNDLSPSAVISRPPVDAQEKPKAEITQKTGES